MRDRPAPAWQQEAYLRLTAGETPSDGDIRDIAERLAAGEAWQTPQAPRVSGTSTPSQNEPIVINEIKIIDNVNALIADQTLTFAPTGLTIVYGDNGSGKSGYARLLKHAAKARVSEEILGNVRTERHDSPSKADICATVAGQPLRFEWNNSPSALARVHYYDSQCGQDYLVRRSPVEYRPPDLRWLEALVDVCRRVGDELNILSEEAKRDQVSLPSLTFGRPAQEFLNKLSADTPLEEIDQWSQFSETQEAAIEHLRRRIAQLEGEEPAQRKQQHEERVAACNFIISHLKELEQQFDRRQLTRLAERQAEITTRKEAAKLALAGTIDSSSLNGVGSDTWLALWRAAREYSEQHAYPRLHYPNIAHGARCVLCQQYLDDEAQARMRSFDGAVAHSLIDAAAKNEAELADELEQVKRTEIRPTSVTEAIGKIQTLNPSLAIEINSQLKMFEEVKKVTVEKGFSAGAIGEFQDSTERLRQTLREMAHSESFSATAINTLNPQSVIGDLQRGLADLQDRRVLRDYKDQILREKERLLRVQYIKNGTSEANTRVLTRKITELVRQHVTDEMRAHFSSLAEDFGVLVKLVETGGERGQLMTDIHLADTLGQYADKKETVLSEGEAHIISLARFFTDAHFDISRSPLILDDPVSSLDQSNRQYVARYILAFASVRQVIVFTHDRAFVRDLVEMKDRDMAMPAERWIGRTLHGEPGVTEEAHPWNVKSVEMRLKDLQGILDVLQNSDSTLLPSEQEREFVDWAGKLSETLERSLRVDLVGTVVSSETTEVQPNMLRIFRGFSEKLEEEYQTLYHLVSYWARRHDVAPERGPMTPELADLKEALSRARKWRKDVKKLREEPTWKKLRTT